MKEETSSNDVFHLDEKECRTIILIEDQVKGMVFKISVVIIALLVSFYGLQVFIRIRSVAVTIVVVWLSNRYYTDRPLENPLDVFTVYFIVWQFVQLICHWQSHELWWPALILQQASLCLFTAFTALIPYEIIVRPLPSQFYFTVLWIRSLIDM